MVDNWEEMCYTPHTKLTTHWKLIMTIQIPSSIPSNPMDRQLFLNSVAQAEAEGEDVPAEVYLFSLRVLRHERAERMATRSAKDRAKSEKLQKEAEAHAKATEALDSFLSG